MDFTIAGTGSCLPDFSVGNSEFADLVDTSDEWISTRTGIKRRHFLKGQSLLEIASRAARGALENAGLAPERLDLILCATVQGPDVFPALACLVQAELGASCPAFDLNAGCTGFLYALDAAAAYFRSGRARHVLIVCAEQLSRFLDWGDRSTCVLFGDGTGAAVLSPGNSLLSLRIGAAGRREDLCLAADGPAGPFWDAGGAKDRIHMNGREIFRFAVTTVQRETEAAMRSAGIAADDVDYFLLHQANGRIVDSVRERLGQPEEKFPTNLSECGNTSSSSIPMLLDGLNREKRLRPGNILLLCAFGAGLTWGTCIIRWNSEPKNDGGI